MNVVPPRINTNELLDSPVPQQNCFSIYPLSFCLLFICVLGCRTEEQVDISKDANPSATQEQPADEAQESAGHPESKDDMKILAKVSIEHHTKEGKGPSDWDSFIRWAEANSSESVKTLQGLRQAGVVFYCEQDARKATAGQSNSIFAYYPSVPEEGGVVALMIGSVVDMSAEDFSKMLETQTKFDPDNVAKKSN